MIKRYPWVVFLFAFMGCATIAYQPVTHSDQRILFEEFSFLPPNGENWQVTRDPLEGNLTFETWGRITVKAKVFKKSIVRPNQTPAEAEIWKAIVSKYEFAIMNFDHDDDLMELAQGQGGVRGLGGVEGLVVNRGAWMLLQPSLPHMALAQGGVKGLDRKGMGLLESSFSHEDFKGMNCVRSKGKAEGGRRISRFELSAVISYFQGYICVHPKYPNHIIELLAEQSVLKGQTPTDFQAEIEPFFNSLKVH